jgi:hypothetical protein
MLTYEPLSRDQHSKYGPWLKAQYPQTLHVYFGHSMDKNSIDALVKHCVMDEAIT